MNIVCIQKWTQTVSGLDVSLYHSPQYKIGSGKNPTMIVGGVHGDEPEGVFLAESLLNYLKTLKITSYIKNWIIIPCLNPDGFVRNLRTNFNGVDLNRNFKTPDWTSWAKAARYNPGPQPQSELETQALSKLIQIEQPEILIHCHSWKPSIIYTGDLGLKYATEFSKYSNYPLQDDIGYPTPGSLGQYGWLVHKVPVICIEEREGATQSETWERFKPAFLNVLGVTH